MATTPRKSHNRTIKTTKKGSTSTTHSRKTIKVSRTKVKRK
jgi:hypothetical protein